MAWREQKDRLGEVNLSREALHLLRREGTTVDEDAELISLQRREVKTSQTKYGCSWAAPCQSVSLGINGEDI